MVNVAQRVAGNAAEMHENGGKLPMTAARILCAAGAALVIGCPALLAMSPGQMPEQAPPTWEQLLALQLDDEKKCLLSGTVFVREMPSAEGVIISGRVKCFDGRQFDFSQAKPHMKFDIRACEPTVC
jgi:hypothetical protein